MILSQRWIVQPAYFIVEKGVGRGGGVGKRGGGAASWSGQLFVAHFLPNCWTLLLSALCVDRAEPLLTATERYFICGSRQDEQKLLH